MNIMKRDILKHETYQIVITRNSNGVLNKKNKIKLVGEETRYQSKIN